MDMDEFCDSLTGSFCCNFVALDKGNTINITLRGKTGDIQPREEAQKLANCDLIYIKMTQSITMSSIHHSFCSLACSVQEKQKMIPQLHLNDIQFAKLNVIYILFFSAREVWIQIMLDFIVDEHVYVFYEK